MKIVTGISNTHNPEDIGKYAEAGVDEFFIGYVPSEWRDVYGFEISCNRREHSKYQYHKLADIERVVELIHQADRKVFLTLNAHEYNQDQFQLVKKILNSIKHIAFDGYILSNLALMLELRKSGITKPFNISIGAGNSTLESILLYEENVENVHRYILPRKFTQSELAEITSGANEKSIKLEAFLLGDPCHFSDEYCFTWHGAENASLCNSPMYKNKTFSPLIFDTNWKKEIFSDPVSKFYENHSAIKHKVEHRRAQISQSGNKRGTGKEELKKLNVLARMGKCGLCMIQKFKEWDVDAVKLPLRGYNVETNLQVIQLVKNIINTSNASPQYCKNLLGAPSFCAGENCYYDYPYPK